MSQKKKPQKTPEQTNKQTKNSSKQTNKLYGFCCCNGKNFFTLAGPAMNSHHSQNTSVVRRAVIQSLVLPFSQAGVLWQNLPPHPPTHTWQKIVSLNHLASIFCLFFISLISRVKHYLSSPPSQTLVRSLDTMYFLVWILMFDSARLLHSIPTANPLVQSFINFHPVSEILFPFSVLSAGNQGSFGPDLDLYWSFPWFLNVLCSWLQMAPCCRRAHQFFPEGLLLPSQRWQWLLSLYFCSVGGGNWVERNTRLCTWAAFSAWDKGLASCLRITRFFFRFYFTFIFRVWEFCLSVWLCTTYMLYLWRPDRLLAIGVTEGWEWRSKWVLGPVFQEQPVLLTTELSF